MRVLSLFAVAVGLTACPKPMAKGTPPERFCPAGPGCERGNDGVFKAGVAVVAVTPRFERPRPDSLSRAGDCSEPAPLGRDGRPRCGKLVQGAFTADCGADGLCPGDMGYVAPDANGSERDGRPDFFFDCGRDQKCPGEADYPGPDADGTEGDGKFQGMWMAGFGLTTPAFGVHDDLTARAVVVQNGDVSIALVSVDAVGLFRDDVERIRERVAARNQGVPDYVLVSSTHTHEGVDTMGQWGPIRAVLPERGVDDVWLKDVFIEGVARAVGEAMQSSRPARVYAAQARLGPKTLDVIKDTRDPFVSDDAVTVLKFTEKGSGLVIGSLVSWGNHPEVLGDTNNFLSADFVWALREGVEKGVFKRDGSLVAPGVGGPCVYFSGAVGGMMTPLGARPKSVDGDEPAPRTFAKTKAVGDIVALVALEALAGAREEPAPNLAFGATTLTVPIDNEVFRLTTLPGVDILRRRLPGFDRTQPIGPDNPVMVVTEVSKVQLGGVRFLGVPGELLPELAVGYDAAWAFGAPQLDPANPAPPVLANAPPPPYLKELLGGELPTILGLANDELGYLIPEYDYVLHPDSPYSKQAPGDHYEETNSLGPRTVPMLLEAFKTLTGWEPAP
jgi:hypothetical protein